MLIKEHSKEIQKALKKGCSPKVFRLGLDELRLEYERSRRLSIFRSHIIELLKYVRERKLQLSPLIVREIEHYIQRLDDEGWRNVCIKNFQEILTISTIRSIKRIYLYIFALKSREYKCILEGEVLCILLYQYSTKPDETSCTSRARHVHVTWTLQNMQTKNKYCGKFVLRGLSCKQNVNRFLDKSFFVFHICFCSGCLRMYRNTWGWLGIFRVFLDIWHT